MNIFLLHKDPTLAAQMQCDKHVVKMVLETAQLLCSPFEPDKAPYKRTHYNHPCSVWARESISNYNWLLHHGQALAAEYTYRYGRRHKSQDVIEWCRDNKLQLMWMSRKRTQFALAMPDEYKTDCPVQSYRNYYLGEKMSIAQWNKSRNMPKWVQDHLTLTT